MVSDGGSTVTVVHEAAPPVGVLEVKMPSASLVIAQKLMVGQEMPVSAAVPTVSTVQVANGLVGSVEYTRPPPLPTPMHSERLGQA